MDWTAATRTASSIAQAWTEEGGPGGAVLLFDAASIRTEACGGLAILEHALPFTPDTVVRYASITKHFLASLVLSVPEAMRPNDLLGDHVPGLRPSVAGVSVGHALDMTGGIPDVMETLWLLGVPWTASMDRRALLEFARTLDGLNFPTGTEISYSNTGYRLVEAGLNAAGIEFFPALRERFLDPLGLVSIRFPEDWLDPVPDLAPGYWRGETGWRRGAYGMHFSGSGGLAGSARDLAAWAGALLADRDPVEGLLARLSAPRHLLDGRPTEYGLGLAWQTLGERRLVGHGGSLPGYKNHVLMDPASGAGVVVLSNREDTDALGTALRVMAALFGEELPTPAADALPDGMYVAEGGAESGAEGGPGEGAAEAAWLLVEGATVTFMGAGETVYDAGEGWVASRAAHLPMRLRREGESIVGEVGHMPRRFRPLRPEAVPDEWSGTWVAATQNARFALRGERIVIGAGALRTELPLTPLGEGRALTDRSDGPWRQRACLRFRGDEVLLATNRSRVLRFVRAE